MIRKLAIATLLVGALYFPVVWPTLGMVNDHAINLVNFYEDDDRPKSDSEKLQILREKAQQVAIEANEHRLTLMVIVGIQTLFIGGILFGWSIEQIKTKEA